MKKNMGSIDKVIRILVAVVFVALYFMEVVTGTLGIILLVLAVVFVLTSFISFCPLYMPFGINTSAKKQ
jgi:uncharacterized MAPEG superfamily protein